MNLYNKNINNTVTCNLCPNFCELKKDQYGICMARKSDGKSVFLDAYGKITNIAVENIEKKPFFHFMHGSKTLSVGSYGCSMDCDFCCEENSMIMMEDGFKKIKDCSVGDSIFCLNEENKEICKSSIESVSLRLSGSIIEIECENGNCLKVTEEHPIFTSNGWINAGNLTENDEIIFIY